MDGLQYMVEEIHMFSPELMARPEFQQSNFIKDSGEILTYSYEKCLFLALEIMENAKMWVILNCEDGKHIIPKEDIERILSSYYPELLL